MRRIRDRDVRRIAIAPFQIRHWRALGGILRTFDSPVEALRRYLSNAGEYPWRPTLRTPLGLIRPTLADRHDLLTVNEIFCRRDYGDGPYLNVVDIGANVGLASLFFLTRSEAVRVWAFEPDPTNVARLREAVSDYSGRIQVWQVAVTADEVASVRFTFMGRYGHTSDEDEVGQQVTARQIGELLRTVAGEVGRIDLVKIDTEGSEADLVAAIPPDVEIGAIVYEDRKGFTQWVRGKR